MQQKILKTHEPVHDTDSFKIIIIIIIQNFDAIMIMRKDVLCFFCLFDRVNVEAFSNNLFIEAVAIDLFTAIDFFFFKTCTFP